MDGNLIDLNYLFDSINMSNEAKQKCYDKTMSAIMKRPIIDIFELEEYIKHNFKNYHDGMSMEEWLTKNQKDNLEKWMYYLSIEF